MPVKQLDDIYDTGVDCLGTTQDDNGTILAQTGNVVDATDSVSPNCEVWAPSGIISRPAPPTVGVRAAQSISITGGSNDIIIAFRDQRANIQVGAGETCLYAPGPDGAGGTQILIQNGTVTITAGTILLGAGASMGVLRDSSGGPLTTWAQGVDTAIEGILATLNSFIPGTGGASLAVPAPSYSGSFPTSSISTTTKST